jgi:hypothetical protein
MFSMAKTSRQDEGSIPQRRNRVAAVGNDARLLGQSAFARAGFADMTLVLHWAEIVGPEVARLARPLKLVDNASGGVLTLKAEAAASVFLQHESRALCARINAYLGRAAVGRLRFVFGSLAMDNPRSPGGRRDEIPLPTADPARGFEGPEDLKDALLGLAGTRRQRTGNRGD